MRAGIHFQKKSILSFLKSKGRHDISVTTSTVASHIMLGGETAQSAFKIHITFNGETTCNHSEEPIIYHSISQVDLIVYD